MEYYTGSANVDEGPRTTADDPALQSKSPGGELHPIEIAALKGNEGDKSYNVPRDTNLDHYNTSAIYCERFHAILEHTRFKNSKQAVYFLGRSQERANASSGPMSPALAACKASI